MATITRTYTPATGDTILAAHLNTDLNTIYTDYNGNIDNDNIVAGAAIEISKTTLDTYTDFANYTPVISGGTVVGAGTYTTQKGRWSQIGNIVYFAAQITISAHTGSGTARISLPTTAGTFDVQFRCPSHVSSVDLTADTVNLTGVITTGATTVYIVESHDNAAGTNMALDAIGTYSISGFYETA